jgi:hypothetical protein
VIDITTSLHVLIAVLVGRLSFTGDRGGLVIGQRKTAGSERKALAGNAVEDSQPQTEGFVLLRAGKSKEESTLLQPGPKRTQLEHFIEAVIRGWFGARVLPIGQVIAERWGRSVVNGKLPGGLLVWPMA